MRQTPTQENLTLGRRIAERETATKNLARSETEEKLTTTTTVHRIEGKSLVLLPVNCRSIYNKSFDFRNSVDTYNADVAIGTESWLREEICTAEVFRTDFTTFRRDRRVVGGVVIICVRNYISCAELWVDKDSEMIAVAVKGMGQIYTWEITGIYRAPYEDMRMIERLAARTGYS